MYRRIRLTCSDTWRTLAIPSNAPVFDLSPSANQDSMPGRTPLNELRLSRLRCGSESRDRLLSFGTWYRHGPSASLAPCGEQTRLACTGTAWPSISGLHFRHRGFRPADARWIRAGNRDHRHGLAGDAAGYYHDTNSAAGHFRAA